MDDSEGGEQGTGVDGTIVTALFPFETQDGGRTRWPSTSIENAPKNILTSIETSHGICWVKNPHACMQPIDMSFKCDICSIIARASRDQTPSPVALNVRAPLGLIKNPLSIFLKEKIHTKVRLSLVQGLMSFH